MSGYRFLIVLCLSVVSTLMSSITMAGTPENAPITYEPCYIGCDLSFPYCYGYNILNMDDAVKIEDWKVEGDLVKGRAVANVNGKIKAKVCYQLSLNSKDYLLNDELNLEAEFDFSVKIFRDTPEDNFTPVCIDYEESSITYSSFSFKGDLLKNSQSFFSEIEALIAQEMEYVLEDSLYKAVYESLTGNPPEGKEKRKNIYCGGEQVDQEPDEMICGCD